MGRVKHNALVGFFKNSKRLPPPRNAIVFINDTRDIVLLRKILCDNTVRCIFVKLSCELVAIDKRIICCKDSEMDSLLNLEGDVIYFTTTCDEALIKYILDMSVTRKPKHLFCLNLGTDLPDFVMDHVIPINYI